MEAERHHRNAIQHLFSLPNSLMRHFFSKPLEAKEMIAFGERAGKFTASACEKRRRRQKLEKERDENIRQRARENGGAV